MKLDDLFISKKQFRVEIQGSILQVVEDKNGHYKGYSKEDILKALTSSNIPLNIEVKIGGKWYRMKPFRRNRHRRRLFGFGGKYS